MRARTPHPHRVDPRARGRFDDRAVRGLAGHRAGADCAGAGVRGGVPRYAVGAVPGGAIGLALAACAD
ncbi:hypothetical protein ACQ4WX_47115 [Streptomyces lasalocidi]